MVEPGIFIYIMSTAAFENEDGKGIIPFSMFYQGVLHFNYILGFCFVGYATNSNGKYIEMHSVAEYLSIIYPEQNINTIYDMLGIQPITREEYYNLIK